jgi:hypothetical protein
MFSIPTLLGAVNNLKKYLLRDYSFATDNVDDTGNYNSVNTDITYSDNAAVFNGTTSYIQITPANDSSASKLQWGYTLLDKPFSFSLWVKPTDITSTGYLISKVIYYDDAYYWEYQIYMYSSRISFLLFQLLSNVNIRASVSDITPYMSSGAWSHIVCTYDGSSSEDGLSVYIDGIKRNDASAMVGTYTAMSGASHAPTLIGKIEMEDTYASFEGSINEVQAHDTELSQARVTALYNSQIGDH